MDGSYLLCLYSLISGFVIRDRERHQNKSVHMKSYVPLLITLPRNLVAELDQASEVLGWTRMALIRRCIIRDMQFVLERELPRIKEAKGSDDHAAWIARMLRPFNS